MGNILELEGIPVLYAEDSASAGHGVRVKGNAVTGAILVDIGSTAITANMKPSTGVMFTGTATATAAQISIGTITDSAGFCMYNQGDKIISLSFDNSKWMQIMPKSSFSLDSENLVFHVKCPTALETSDYVLVVQQQLP